MKITKSESNENGAYSRAVTRETGSLKKEKPAKDFAKEDECRLLSLQYEGVSLPHLSFIQHSALLSSFPTKQKLPRYSPESGIELY